MILFGKSELLILAAVVVMGYFLEVVISEIISEVIKTGIFHFMCTVNEISDLVFLAVEWKKI